MSEFISTPNEANESTTRMASSRRNIAFVALLSGLAHGFAPDRLEKSQTQNFAEVDIFNVIAVL